MVTFDASFLPGNFSTPLFTSTADGFTFKIASLIFFGFNPPDKITGDLKLNAYWMSLDVEYIDFTSDQSLDQNWLNNLKLPVDSSITLEERFGQLYDLDGDIDRIANFKVNTWAAECTTD